MEPDKQVVSRASVNVASGSELLPGEVLTGTGIGVSIEEGDPPGTATSRIALWTRNGPKSVGFTVHSAKFPASGTISGDYELGGTRQNFNQNQLIVGAEGGPFLSAVGRLHLEQTDSKVAGSFDVQLATKNQLGAASSDFTTVTGTQHLAGTFEAQIDVDCWSRLDEMGDSSRNPGSLVLDSGFTSKFCAQFRVTQ
jgi:hypothetical protein